MSDQTNQTINGTKTAKIIAVSLSAALMATTVLPVTSASAHDRRSFHKHHHHHVIKRKRHRGSNKGDIVAAGIIGLAVGAIVAGSAHQRRHHRSPRVVYEERISPPRPIYEERIYDNDIYDRRGRRLDRPYSGGNVERRTLNDASGPKVITYEDGATASTEPWTPGWVSYCKRKYRSFSETSGTFLGYDGKRHFCVVR